MAAVPRFPVSATSRTVSPRNLAATMVDDFQQVIKLIPIDKAKIAIGDVTALQRKGEFPDEPDGFISRVDGRKVNNEALFAAIRRARPTARVELTPVDGGETLTAPFRMLRNLIAARAPVATGRYKSSFQFYLNGKEVTQVQDVGSGGESIILCFNTAPYASSLETMKIGGVLHGIAVQIKSAFPKYRIGFNYRKADDLSQDVRVSTRTGQQQYYAVPVIYIGTPSSNAINGIKLPGRNARRRARSRRRSPRGNL